MQPGDAIKFRTIAGEKKDAIILEIDPDGGIMASVDDYPHPISLDRIIKD